MSLSAPFDQDASLRDPIGQTNSATCAPGAKAARGETRLRDLVVLGHLPAEQQAAFAQPGFSHSGAMKDANADKFFANPALATRAAPQAPAAPTLVQSLNHIEAACTTLNLPRHYYALGDAITNSDLDGRVILFFISHLTGPALYQHMQALLSAYPTSLVVPIVEYADQAVAAALLELGCVDFLLAPFSSAQCAALLQRLLTSRPEAAQLVAEAPASRRLLAMAERVAATAAPILITGETGTGKEQLARHIHQHYAACDAPFIAINCAAIPEAMLESLLFGHEKGAFTGAVTSQPGKFELAQNGTLLLDEIGELPLALQAKLLRVLQEKTVERLGGRREIALNVRIIAATNRDLREEVAAGRFRADLLFRLDVLPLHISPLRERSADIMPLAQAFVAKYAPEDAREDLFTADACAALLRYPFPGNVRELENMVQRALVLRKGLLIQAQDLGLPTAADAAAPETRAIDDWLQSLTQQSLSQDETVNAMARAEDAAADASLSPSEQGDQNPHTAEPYRAQPSVFYIETPVSAAASVSLHPVSPSPVSVEGASLKPASHAPAAAATYKASFGGVFDGYVGGHVDDYVGGSKNPVQVGSALTDTGRDQAGTGRASLKARGKWAEYEHVLATIAHFGGHKTKAAASLGMTTRALRYRLNAMREQGISIPF